MAWVEVASKGNNLFYWIGDSLSSGSDSLYHTKTTVVKTQLLAAAAALKRQYTGPLKLHTQISVASHVRINFFMTLTLM